MNWNNISWAPTMWEMFLNWEQDCSRSQLFKMKIWVVGMSGLKWSPCLRWHSRCFSQMVMNNPLPLLIKNPMVAFADDSILLSLACRSQQSKMWAAELGSDLGTTLVCTLAQCPSGEFCSHKCLGGKGVKVLSPEWGSPRKLALPGFLGHKAVIQGTGILRRWQRATCPQVCFSTHPRRQSV